MIIIQSIKNKLKMKHFIYLLVAAVFTSCIHHKDRLYEVITESPFSEDRDVCVIIPICHAKDSVLICTGVEDFAYSINRSYLISWEMFSEQLCKVIKQKGYIHLYDDAYKEFVEEYESYVVQEVPHIKSIYQSEGIKGIFRKYISNGFLESSQMPKLTNKEYNYLIYLLFQHGLYCRTVYDPENPITYVINPEDL